MIPHTQAFNLRLRLRFRISEAVFENVKPGIINEVLIINGKLLFLSQLIFNCCENKNFRINKRHK